MMHTVITIADITKVGMQVLITEMFLVVISLGYMNQMIHLFVYFFIL